MSLHPLNVGHKLRRLRRRPVQTLTNTVVSNRKLPVAVDTNGWLNRNQATDLLGVSANTLANHERRGSLHPQHVMRPDARGTPRRTSVYDPKELAKLPRYRRHVETPEQLEIGEFQARCFELFLQGRSIVDIVILLREPLDEIIGLREQWLDNGHAHLVISPEAKDALEKAVGPFSNVAELVKIICPPKIEE